MSSGVLRTVLVQPTFPFLSLWQLFVKVLVKKNWFFSWHFVRLYDYVAFLFCNELTVQSLMVPNYLYWSVFFNPVLFFLQLLCSYKFKILNSFFLFLSYFLPIYVSDSEPFSVSCIFLARPHFFLYIPPQRISSLSFPSEKSRLYYRILWF